VSSRLSRAYELPAPDGARVLAMHVANRRGAEPDVILAADDTELLHLRPTGHLALGSSEALAALGVPVRGGRAARWNAVASACAG
jgi:hypothetical protein